MAYTPELSQKGSANFGIAWFRRKPMTRTLEEMVAIVVKELNRIKPGAVCRACRDKSKCSNCVFRERNPDLKIVLGKE